MEKDSGREAVRRRAASIVQRVAATSTRRQAFLRTLVALVYTYYPLYHIIVTTILLLIDKNAIIYEFSTVN